MRELCQWLAPIRKQYGNASLSIDFNVYLIGLANKRYMLDHEKYDSCIYPINNNTIHYYWGSIWTKSNNLGVEMYCIGY